MRNIRIMIEYDGTDFIGWQIQKSGRSVQAVVKAEIDKLLQENVNLIGAGRTDSGVHARGQVANFKTESGRELIIIYKALNNFLPRDVIIRKIDEVPLEFNSRYDAIERRYRYYISTERISLYRDYYLHCYYNLNRDILTQCAEFIKTKLNFRSFCYANADVKHHNCEIHESRWIFDDKKIIFEVAANRFLHGMVRSLVGTMLDVSRGYISLEQFMEIFDKEDRRAATKAAPAKGLVLEEVVYRDNLRF